ncbi:MAG: glycosyltransferase family 2 protein [Nonlabens sp.]|nr:glycosyltransferase family 2 protein [Nonlabens sp.]
MRIAIIIPAHNEEDFIEKTLHSLMRQTYPASRIVVVNDNSSDNTSHIVSSLQAQNRHISLLEHQSTDANIPGSKVIRAFHAGLETINTIDYDIICKFDADLIFPADYLEQLVQVFNSKPKAGIVAGHCTVEQQGNWVVEQLTNKDHVRGALKAYRSDCFKEIGGLKTSIGWDTIDEMVARYHGWEVVTIPGLHVKHLKPTGASYNPSAKYLQGEAFYKMRYGWTLTFITALKMSLNKKNPRIVADYLVGYHKSKNKNLEPLVTEAQGRFIRSYRWKGIFKKLGFKN